MESDNYDLLLLCASACAVIADEEEKKKTRKNRRFWARNFLLRRNSCGAYESIMKELKLEDRQGFKNFVRMSPTDFENLLKLVAPHITLQNTNCRDAISAAEQLAVTLRFLATGDSFSSLMYLHRISKSKISQIIPKVCDVIALTLHDYIKMPDSINEWSAIAEGYMSAWNFPHCIGAMDGKHIQITQPPHSGSLYYNYKGSFSIVLLALVDACYRFTYVNVGIQGRISDGGVFNHTSLFRQLSDGSLNLPSPIPLPGREKNSPFVIVADDAFALTQNIMKPFPGSHDRQSVERIFNYRLSRARRVVENVFGIMSAVFRVFRKPMNLSPEKAATVTLAAAYLHNYLRRNKESKMVYSPPGMFDDEDSETGSINPGSWRQSEQSFVPLQKVGRKTPQEVKSVRKEFASFFISAKGKVKWQDSIA